MGARLEHRERLRTVVCDTGPLLHLAEAGLLDLLFQAGKICCPPGVRDELDRLSTQSDRTERPRVVALDEASRSMADDWLRAGILDRGEAEALALSQQLRATWFLTDDTAARLLAKREGLEVHGSLGVLLWGAATKRLDLQTAKAGLDRLAESTLWLSARVLAEAGNALATIARSR